MMHSRKSSTTGEPQQKNLIKRFAGHYQCSTIDATHCLTANGFNWDLAFTDLVAITKFEMACENDCGRKIDLTGKGKPGGEYVPTGHGHWLRLCDECAREIKDEQVCDDMEAADLFELQYEAENIRNEQI